MATIIDVPTAAFAIANAPDSLSTIGIGSCVVICLYAKDSKVGALLHFMLPRKEQDTSNPARYADTAINTVLQELISKGISPANLSAKIIGGAQMFQIVDSEPGIGQQNVEEANRLLEIMKIPVLSKEIGGNIGRSLIFDLETGIVSISYIDPNNVQKI